MEQVRLELQDHFDLVKQQPISQVVFIHDYYELWMQEDYMRFFSEVTIEKDGKKYPIPSKDGNFLFSSLINDKLVSIEEDETCITINTQSGVKIIVDTVLEAPCENFHMAHKGQLAFMA